MPRSKIKIYAFCDNCIKYPLRVFTCMHLTDFYSPLLRILLGVEPMILSLLAPRSNVWTSGKHTKIKYILNTVYTVILTFLIFFFFFKKHLNTVYFFVIWENYKIERVTVSMWYFSKWVSLTWNMIIARKG